MTYPEYSLKIIALRDQDLKLRQELLDRGELNEGYNKEMELLHLKNTHTLEEIIDDIGYPTIDKVGQEASEATWIIIQHSISSPDFMRKCLRLLESATIEKKVNPQNLASLSDRIAVFEGRPQVYATQYDWDEHGNLSPREYDDIQKVNKRRNSIGLCTVEENTRLIRERTKQEGGKPPSDLKSRNKEYEIWRRHVGWI